MAPQMIMSDRLKPPAPPLSHAARTGNLVFVSGITPYGPGAAVAVGDFPAQMLQVMDNIKIVLEESGSSMDKILKTTVVLVRIGDFQAMNEVYKSYFAEGKYPARITFEAALNGKDFLLEIDCVAEI